MSDILIQKQEPSISLLTNEINYSRDGDWVCIKCNNLNFSFRRKCNRCKIQTREQNDDNLFYAYHYYKQYYDQSTNYSQEFEHIKQQDLQNIETIQSKINRNNRKYSLNYSAKYQFNSQNKEIANKQYNLPSVSPIIKRYKKQRNSQNYSKQSAQNQQYNCQRQYLHEYCWNNITNDQYNDNQIFILDQNDLWDTEIEKIVQNIVI